MNALKSRNQRISLGSADVKYRPTRMALMAPAEVPPTRWTCDRVPFSASTASAPS